jgi:hypothetical protein
MADSNELAVVTARFLADGAPAYLKGDGSWSRSLQEAGPRAPAEAEAEALARAQSEQRIVADPYVIKVEIKGGQIDALTTRERIRSTGPTVRIRRPD